MAEIKIYNNFEDMLNKNKVLVSIETVKIKDFIFNTNKLKTIRGASYLLDYLNQVEVPKILEKYGIKYNGKKIVKELYSKENNKEEKEERENREFLEKIDKVINFNGKSQLKEEDIIISQNILYIGAGNAKFLVESEEIAQKICKEIKEKYEEMAPSVKIVAEYEKIDKNENGEDEKIWDVIDKLAKKTAIKKSEGFPLLNIDLPFVEKCALSGSEPAVISKSNYKNDLEKIGIHETGYEGIDEKNLKSEEEQKQEQKIRTEEEIKKVLFTIGGNAKISEATAAKIKFSNKMIKDDINEIGFYSIIKNGIDNIYLEAQIEDYSIGDSFVGLVYSDGDGLGDFLKNCKKRYNTEEKYLKFLRKFSIVLDRNTKVALRDVLVEIEKKYKFKTRNGKKVIGEFLIVGGDDVCAIFPADIALEISYKFQKNFEEKMKVFSKEEKDEENNITSSSGVVIAKDKTPMYQLFEQGIKLQKFAKQKRYEDVQKNKEKEKTGYIDFQNIGGEGLVNIGKYRENLFEEKNNEKIKVSNRPYSINKINNDTETIETLINKIKKLKEVSFPNTKLRYVYNLKKDETLTNNEKIMEAVNILSKMNEKELKILDEIWGIKDKMSLEKNIDNLFSDILDVIEMYDFVAEISKEDKNE